MDTTLREVEDQDNNASPLFLATNGIQIKSTVDVRTDSAFIDLYDSGDTNYFTFSKSNDGLAITNVRQVAVTEPVFIFQNYDDSNTVVTPRLTMTKGGSIVTRVPKTQTANAATLNVDLSTGNIQNITLQQSTTITLTNPPTGGVNYQLIITQGGIGSYTVTWATSINWKSNTPPTITAAVGFNDIIFLLWDGFEYYGWYEQGMP